MKKLFFNLFLLATTVTFAQVHINEFDVNANNNEIFIELKSEQSNFLLDGYQILFIKQDEKDQSKNHLYYKININEITKDDNEFILIGNKNVNPLPIVTFNTKIIESTPMYLALYKGEDNLTLYEYNENLNLIEVIAYGNSSDKPLNLFNQLSERMLIDFDNNLSFQIDEYNSFVYKNPSPGFDFYNPKLTLPEEDFILESTPEKAHNKSVQSSSSNYKTSKFYFPDGRVLEGYFPNEIHTGKGIYTFTNGDAYEGDIVDDEITGFGIFKWKNGDRYEGMFLNGVLNGRGTMYFTDGDRYEGFFKNNLFHGKGKLINSNGEIKDGEYFEGNLKE